MLSLLSAGLVAMALAFGLSSCENDNINPTTTRRATIPLQIPSCGNTTRRWSPLSNSLILADFFPLGNQNHFVFDLTRLCGYVILIKDRHLEDETLCGGRDSIVRRPPHDVVKAANQGHVDKFYI